MKIEPDRIPDPGRLKLLTADGVRQYKLEVLSHVLEQIKEPIRLSVKRRLMSSVLS